MIRQLIAMSLLAAACALPAAAQTPPASKARSTFLRPDEIIRQIPGRWEYRPEDGWTAEMIRQPIRCSSDAERIWFDRDAKGIVYHSQNEGPGSKMTTSRVGTEGIVPFLQPLIRIQYEGEKGWDKDGKPIVWEIWMSDPDTFYWRIKGWPPGTMMPPIRRCKEKPTS